MMLLFCVTSSRTIPSASKLSPGQAAYHFLAGHQNGKFVPAFHKGPSSIDPLELAKALMFVVKLETLCSNKLIISRHLFPLTTVSAYIIMVQLKEQQIPSFLVNAKGIESGRKKWFSFSFSSERIDLVMQWNYSLCYFFCFQKLLPIGYHL